MGLYRKLAQRLDTISFGFPKSFLGADIGALKAFFEKEDARDFLAMSDGYQTAKMYAEKNGLTEEEAKAKLDRMANKGLIFRRHREEDEYDQHPIIMGIVEWQINNPKRKKWLRNFAMYMISSKFASRMGQTMPFYRTVPMHKEYVQGSIVAPYEDIEEILNRHKRFAVGICLCRTIQTINPTNKCNHPLETCIETDDYADFYIETGLGREITKEEALAILREGEKDGRVINVTNSKDGENICSCCDCGCGMLYLKKKYPGPSADFWSNYYSEITEDACVKCGVCATRCPFKAISLTDGKMVVDKKKCLGCGICVSTCGPKAIHLVKKPEEQLYEPPETYDDAIQIWEKKTVKNYNRFK